MAATTVGYEWSRSSPPRQSPDMASPMYPDRPIRPMPKRKLRSRLSPEQADTIIYPPAPPSSAPLFTFPYGQAEKGVVASGRQQHVEHEHTCDCGGGHSEVESEEDEDERAALVQSSPSYARSAMNGKARPGIPNGYPKPPPPDSTTSSADGYESFENTNNKKKRKIPVSGSAGGHHTSLSPEMANMGISPHGGNPPPVDDTGRNGVGQYYGTGSAAISSPASGTGISGAGRGRYGRSGRASTERRPLGASTNGLNAYANGGSGRRRDWNGSSPSGKGPHPDQGIISAAIASAAERAPATPQKGDENVSLLQQQASRTTPTKGQFTFTCESDSSNKMVWPGQNGSAVTTPSPAPSSMPPTSHIPLPAGMSNRRSYASHATQPSTGNGIPHGGIPASQHPQQQAANGQQPPPQPKKPRPRNPNREYRLAARQRRLQQEYNNYHHPPSRDEIWICEFCEYESIFGTPPEALIRQYEIKDRKERKRLAEKRRLLEKAKMKNRKGKKGGKAAAKGAGAGNPAAQQQNHAQGQRYDQPLNNVPLPNAENPGEEYFEDEFDEVPISVPPAPVSNGKASGGYVDGQYGGKGGTAGVPDAAATKKMAASSVPPLGPAA